MIFENFLKFSKRRRAVPLLSMQTIMVAAKQITVCPCDQVSSKSVNVEGQKCRHGPIAAPVPKALELRSLQCLSLFLVLFLSPGNSFVSSNRGVTIVCC